MNLSSLVAPAILAGIVAGLIFPQFGSLSFLTTIFLGFVIFSASLNVTPESLKQLVKKPQHYIFVLLIVFVLQPIATYALARAFVKDPIILAGIVLASMAPVATGLGFWTNALRGKVSIALAFTTITHLLAPAAVPALAYFLLRSIITVSILSIAKSLALVIIIPFVLALLLQRFEKIKSLSLPISLVAYFLLIAAITSPNRAAIFSNQHLLLISAFVLFQCIVSGMLSLFFSWNWERADREPFIMGTIARDNAVIMAVALTGFGPLAALPCAVAIVLQLFAVSVYIHFRRPRN